MSVARLLALTWIGACVVNQCGAAVVVKSPDGHVEVAFELQPPPNYRVSYRGKTVIPESPLGITFHDAPRLSNLAPTSIQRAAHDETYPLVADKTATARDHYNEVTITLAERSGPGRVIQLQFRAYNDGVAFRYRLPEQPGLKSFAIASEDTTFTLPPDAKAWLLPVPNHTSHYEFYYRPAKVAEIKPDQLIGLPLLVELKDGPALAITEANLTDYAGMYLTPSAPGSNVLESSLSPLPNRDGVKVIGDAPHDSPWRVIMLADSPGKLIESNLVTNLSDPCAIADTSWIKPGKVAFLWWNGYLVGHNGVRGGVNTATFKHYVDAAAEFGFAYSSIDGLDVAWYGGKIPGYGEQDITVPVAGLDIQDVLAHAKRKNVRIRLWVASQGLRKHLDRALATYAAWGVEGIMVDFIERDDQETVNWVREVVEKCAKHKLTVTLHNVSKPTGLRRTLPNLVTREAVLNQEWNKWSPGSTPDHELTVPFTRMLAGPLDYHSGCFRSVRIADFAPRDVAPEVMGTRCHQLAMYVVYENPMPMAVDYPAAYRGKTGIEFLRDVPTTWYETRFVHGKIGDFITLARRKGADWWLGSMTDADARELQIPLTFLGEGTFTAETWSDGSLQDGPNAATRETKRVTRADTLTAKLAPAGGFAARLSPAKSE